MHQQMKGKDGSTRDFALDVRQRIDTSYGHDDPKPADLTTWRASTRQDFNLFELPTGVPPLGTMTFESSLIRPQKLHTDSRIVYSSGTG